MYFYLNSSFYNSFPYFVLRVPGTPQVSVKESQTAFWESEALNPASGKTPDYVKFIIMVIVSIDKFA